MRPLNRIFKSSKSLKIRLRAFLIFSCIVPIVLMSAVTIHKVYSLYKENVARSIENELLQSKNNIQNYIQSMLNMSQQLSYDGVIGKQLYLYFDKESSKEKIELMKYLNEKISNYEVSNPNISNLTYMYKVDDNTLKPINNSLVREVKIKDENMFYEFGDVRIFGFHPSNSIAWNNNVISMIRKISIKGYDDIYIYIESEMKTTDKLISKNIKDLDGIYNIISNKDSISYSSDISKLSINDLTSKKVNINNKKYYSYSIFDENGWGVNTLIPTSRFHNTLISLGYNYIIIIIISICISVTLAYRIWKSINDPLELFYKKTKNIGKDDIKENIEKINIEEFDESFSYFEKMKKRILEMADSIKEGEKEKKELEIKQLFYKINPHFIYNTLESLKWYSDSKEYKEIGSFISALNKLLIYNLEKEKQTTLEEELIAIENYITLQKIKYNIKFKVDINIPQMMLDSNVPRFVLQPIVENAIFYGELENGEIHITVDILENGKISIKVINNGSIDDSSNINTMINKNNDNISSGIGISYVIKILENKFGESAKFTIQNIPDNKTQVEIIIPYCKGGFYVKDTSC